MKKKTVFDIRIDFMTSHGSYVFDKNTQTNFLDFFSMFSSLPLGYNHRVFDDSFNNKIAAISKVRMANNLFRSDELVEFRNKFRKYVFSDYLHFNCTGALAVESAIKCALEYKKTDNPMVLGVKKSFHGINSWGFVTDRYLGTAERIKHFPRNQWQNLTLDEIRNAIEHQSIRNIVAVIVEPIQCTAGDIYIDPEDLLALQRLCNKHDICFIVDEIQTGFGVTGNMWYSEKIGLDPDILVFGKKSQISGIVVKEKYNECIVSPVRKLEVTFDGELIDAVRAMYILRAYEEDNLLRKVTANSERFRTILEQKVLNYRSTGHLVAFDFENGKERDAFVKACYEKRFLCNSTAEKTVRMRPNMAVSSNEIDHFEELMSSILK